jgi:DNA repair exonuclease SbcCD ATPase subunit
MNLEELIIKIEKLDDQIRSINKSLSTFNNKVNEVDDKTSGFLNLMRDEKNEIARLNSAVMGIGQFDAAITQVRVDFNRKLNDLQKQKEQEEQFRANLIDEDFKSVQTLIERTRTELTKEFDKKLVSFFEENARQFNRFKEIEKKANEILRSSEDNEGVLKLFNQDFRRTVKQVENLQAEVGASRGKQDEIRSKLEVISDSLRNNENRLNEIITTESERKQVQLGFIEKQTLIQKNRDRIWVDWKQQFDEFSKQTHDFLPKFQNQQLGLEQSKNDFEEITQQFERRIKELTEMYRLMDDKFRKEWVTYRSDSEKRWSNISMVIDDKQGGYSDQFLSIKDRMALVEDNTHEMQEVLLLMSTEIQKGMQNIMKMVNGWMDAFGQIKPR